MVQGQQDNIRIQAEGVNVTYEVIDGVRSITISSNNQEYAQPVVQDMGTDYTPLAPSASEDEKTVVNWYEVTKVILLGAILVVLLWKRKEIH